MKPSKRLLVEAKVWRYIPPLTAEGNLQMAIDTWLFQQHRLGQHPPTLRFYRWATPTISLGYHQRRYPDFWRNLTWQGQAIDLVRRPTGGRAVLHCGDLTYTVVTSGLSGNLYPGYESIAQFLIEGWRSLGLELHYGAAGRGYIHSPNCFGTSTRADLVDGSGNKFIGSAQLKQGGFILQHGSMVLQSDRALFEKVFATPAPSPVALAREVSEATIEETLKTSAARCFDCQLRSNPLSVEEWRVIADLTQKLT
jgi:lipoate---protein ligase